MWHIVLLVLAIVMFALAMIGVSESGQSGVGNRLHFGWLGAAFFAASFLVH